MRVVNRVLSFSDLSLRGPLRWSFLLGLAGFDGFSVVLEVAAEELLEEYRESSNPSVVDALNLAANHVLCSVAQGYHQFAQGRLVLPI